MDKERGVVRVIGICFEESASDDFIEKVTAEVLEMETLAPALMTAKALALYTNAMDEYVSERMAIMPIGSSFNYNGECITRWSEHTYNAKRCV